MNTEFKRIIQGGFVVLTGVFVFSWLGYRQHQSDALNNARAHNVQRFVQRIDSIHAHEHEILERANTLYSKLDSLTSAIRTLKTNEKKLWKHLKGTLRDTIILWRLRNWDEMTK